MAGVGEPIRERRHGITVRRSGEPRGSSPFAFFHIGWHRRSLMWAGPEKTRQKSLLAFVFPRKQTIPSTFRVGLVVETSSAWENSRR